MPQRLGQERMCGSGRPLFENKRGDAAPDRLTGWFNCSSRSAYCVSVSYPARGLEHNAFGLIVMHQVGDCLRLSGHCKPVRRMRHMSP